MKCVMIIHIDNMTKQDELGKDYEIWLDENANAHELIPEDIDDKKTHGMRENI